MTLKVRVVQDYEPLNPRDQYGCLGKMFCYHGRYSLGDETDLTFDEFSSWHELHTYLVRVKKAAVVIPLYLYDHSGITMATTPFHCKWDSAQVGYIYTDKETIREVLEVRRVSAKLLSKIPEYLEEEVKTYDQYLRGDAYGYEIYDDESNEILESCWNFYDEEDCKKQGEAALKHMLSQG